MLTFLLAFLGELAHLLLEGLCETLVNTCKLGIELLIVYSNLFLCRLFLLTLLHFKCLGCLLLHAGLFPLLKKPILSELLVREEPICILLKSLELIQ